MCSVLKAVEASEEKNEGPGIVWRRPQGIGKWETVNQTIRRGWVKFLRCL
jgi:hypothetical protein